MNNKINVENSYYDKEKKFKILKWKAPISSLLPRGYKFHKLFARNYKVYCKKIGTYEIWAWVTQRSLEINDWHHTTKNIIDFYLANKNHPDFDKPGFQREKRGYIKVQVNRETGQVQHFDYEEYYKVLQNKDVEKAWINWEKKYGKDWFNEVLDRKDMEQLLKEIKWLQK